MMNQDKTHLLVLTNEFPPKIGGIASYIFGYIQKIPYDRVTVVTKEEQYAPQEDLLPNNRVVLRNRQERMLSPSWWPLVSSTLRLVRHYGVGVIHVHHVLPHGYAAYIAHMLFDIPYTVFFHGSDIFLCTQKRWKKRMAEMILRRAHHVVVGSMFLQNVYTTRFSARVPRPLVIYPSPDTRVSHISKEEADQLRRHMGIEGKVVLLTVARFAASKGHMALLGALKELAATPRQFVALFVGDGYERERVAQAVHSMGLQQYVRFVGPVPHESVSSYYAIADIYVQLSEDVGGREEGFGLSFAEAAQYGLPCVGTRVGGIPEVVVDGVNGVLVDPKDASAGAAKALATLIDDSALRQRCGVSSAEHSAQFTWAAQKDILSQI
jgi:phosphatidyl-myo-inositol dimannoside synthase